MGWNPLDKTNQNIMKNIYRRMLRSLKEKQKKVPVNYLVWEIFIYSRASNLKAPSNRAYTQKRSSDLLFLDLWIAQ